MAWGWGLGDHLGAVEIAPAVFPLRLCRAEPAFPQMSQYFLCRRCKATELEAPKAQRMVAFRAVRAREDPATSWALLGVPAHNPFL